MVPFLQKKVALADNTALSDFMRQWSKIPAIICDACKPLNPESAGGGQASER